MKSYKVIEGRLHELGSLSPYGERWDRVSGSDKPSPGEEAAIDLVTQLKDANDRIADLEAQVNMLDAIVDTDRLRERVSELESRLHDCAVALGYED